MTSLTGLPASPTDDPAQRAQYTMRDRGDELLAELAARAAPVADPHAPLGKRAENRSRLITFCTTTLVRHRLAVDQVLYLVAAGSAETRLLVRALRAQHDLVAARIAEMKRAAGPAELAAAAFALVGLLEACHRVEQDVLIPALATWPGVDLPALVADIDTLLDA